jgi:K+ transporter
MPSDPTIPTRIQQLSRTGGTGIYIDTSQNSDNSPHKNLSKKRTDLPVVLTSFVSRIPVLPETIVLFSVQFLPIPFIAEEDRLVIRPIDEKLGIYRVILNHGYQEMEVDIIGILERARGMGIAKLDTSECIFFVGKINVVSKDDLEEVASGDDGGRGVSRGRLRSLFDLIRRFRINWYEMINKNVDANKDLFHLPPESTIEVGSTVTL